MLDSFRLLANNWLAKLLLLLLILSFGVWGIGDMLRGGGRNPAVVTVGGTKITARAFERELRSETENIQQMLGGNASPELMKSLNLPQRVMQRMVNNALLKLESKRLGLVPDDASIVQRIRSNPMFADDSGHFDKRRFDIFLRNANLTEKHYVETLRQEMAAGLLMDTLTDAVVVPDMAVETLYDARHEQRAAAFYSLRPALAGNVPQPSAAQTEAYYKEHGGDFTAPEYRTLSYVTLSPAEVQAQAKLSDDELRALYKERIDEFKHPERRTLEQLLYDSQAKADKAAALLKSGKSAQQVANSIVPLNQDHLLLGKVARGELPGKAAGAVFALPTGGMTPPIKGPFGWTIYRVVSVEPPSTDDFEQARPQLEKEVKQRDADDALTQLSDKLQDALAGGSTLQEAAHDLHLAVHTTGPVDRQGQAPNGQAVKDMPPFVNFLDTAFKTDEKTESALTPAKDGVFYMLRVDSVTPASLRPLSEVKAQAIAGWQAQERQKKLAALAKDIAAGFAGSGRNAIIAQYHLQPLNAQVKRSSHTAGTLAVTAPLVDAIFARKPGESTPAFPMQNGEYVLAVAGAVIPAPAPDKNPQGKEEMAAIRKALVTDMQNEVLQQYTRALAEQYPSSVNQSALQSLLQ